MNLHQLFHNLPALQVVLPLLSAPLCVLLRSRTGAWALATAVSWLSLLISALLLFRVVNGGVISYAMGGWPPPIGIELRIDHLNAFVLVVVNLIAAVILPYARRSVAAELPAEKIYLFYAMVMLCLSGLLGITITGDAFNVFVFLEISSLSSYALIALGRDRRALVSSFQYLIMGTIGGTFLLIGIGLMYMMTGTLNMMDLAQRLEPVYATHTVQAALAFVVIGLTLKMAVFPLHFWLPGAYAHSPSTVGAFLAATTTKVAAYALIRFVFTIFGVGYAFHQQSLGQILVVLAVAGMIIPSIAAIYQRDAKCLLAYSSVAQIGYIVLGIGLASVTGLTGAILHLLNHAVIKGALFMALGCVVYRTGSVRLDDMRGLGRDMPWTMAAFVAGGLSLIGIPLTAGFISKWYLVQAALARDEWWLAVIVLVSSLLAIAYIWRVVEVAYLRDRPADAAPRREAPLSMLIPTWLLILINVYIGVDSTGVAGIAREAARALIGAGA